MEEQKVFIPPKRFDTDYPVIDTDPHIGRAFRYARRSDWIYGGSFGVMGPAFMLITERYAPAFASRGSFTGAFRLSCVMGLTASVYLTYARSCMRMYGWMENGREVEMDMREMVDKVKKGEPLYGRSGLTPYMQGVAARNSRYSALMGDVIPWANFVNHNQHGVDTAKYYQQAERELEAERVKGE